MAAKIHLRKADKEKIVRFLGLLKKKGIKVSQAILFGSYAKGRVHKDSDMDIAIVSRQFGHNVIEEMMFLRKVAIKIDSHIEPIPLSPLDFKDNLSTLIHEIKLTGKVLHY